MGGIIACHLAVDFRPAKLGLIVSPYQAGSPEDLAGKYRTWYQTGLRDVSSSRYGELQVPFSFTEDAMHYDARESIKNLRCPVMFVAGESDTKVSTAATMKLYAVANQPKTIEIVKGMEHKYQYQPEKLEIVNSLITKFMDTEYSRN
jgi:pimeloyl-ACP methyl ester carboxylesterase